MVEVKENYLMAFFSLSDTFLDLVLLRDGEKQSEMKLNDRIMFDWCQGESERKVCRLGKKAYQRDLSGWNQFS